MGQKSAIISLNGPLSFTTMPLFTHSSAPSHVFCVSRLKLKHAVWWANWVMLFWPLHTLLAYALLESSDTEVKVRCALKTMHSGQAMTGLGKVLASDMQACLFLK